jgi:hypothetical protein
MQDEWVKASVSTNLDDSVGWREIEPSAFRRCVEEMEISDVASAAALKGSKIIYYDRGELRN